MDMAEYLRQATPRSFGYQWTQFAGMVETDREHFLIYISPIDRPSSMENLDWIWLVGLAGICITRGSLAREWSGWISAMPSFRL